FIVNGDITLFATWTQRIKQQPTSDNPTVVVNDKAHASYQWYKVDGTGVNYGDWISTNTAHSSTSNKSYTINATTGQKLTFDWRVSSESYDKLKVTIGSTTLVNTGGTTSGSEEYTFNSSGTYTLTLSYTKDSSVSSGEDKAYVSNIHYGARDLAISGATSATLNPSLVVGRSDCYCVISYSNSTTVLQSDNITLGIVATSISLNRNTLQLKVGETYTLTATILPEDVSNKTVSWSSSNTSVVTVSSSGLVTAKSNGNATITAKTSDGTNLSATCEVIVRTLATSIVLSETNVKISCGETLQLTATVSPATASNSAIAWTSSNTAIASVDESGLITAVGEGSATITAKTSDGSNLEASCAVLVTPMARYYGDVNHDGKITTADITILVDIVLGKREAEVIPSESANMHNGHEYVDLGLPSGLKWATCNIGASAPEEYGDYFAWGEIETRDRYSQETYSFYDTATGSYENLGDISGSEYDVAHEIWKGSWRMPTQSEFKELKDNCEWEWEIENKIYGYKVTGPNGNWIFLPAAGCRYDTDLLSDGSDGYYWSSTPYPYNQSFVCHLYFYSSDISLSNINTRYYGYSVRPVTE
ncbi:MAG: Ig-like domain-containing protein, partial [Prevotellaceae bacterium]|nr:Ig-like domain-containing protein [Prevotellaceae bacterium]